MDVQCSRYYRRSAGVSEFFGIDLKLRPVGIAGGVVRPVLVPIAAGQRDEIALDVRYGGARERYSRVVDDVVARGVASSGRFRRNG